MLVFLRYGVIVLKHVGLPHQRESHQGVLAKHLVVLTAVHSLQGQLHKVAPMPVSIVSAKKSLAVEWRQRLECLEDVALCPRRTICVYRCMHICI